MRDSLLHVRTVNQEIFVVEKFRSCIRLRKLISRNIFYSKFFLQRIIIRCELYCVPFHVLALDAHTCDCVPPCRKNSEHTRDSFVRSICCGYEEGRNYHRTFNSKAVAGVFAVFATGRYTVSSVSVAANTIFFENFSMAVTFSVYVLSDFTPALACTYHVEIFS